MSRPITIVEVGPRDGLQNETTILEPAVRADLVNRLEAAGARRIEAVSFVHPKYVPQMAGAEAVMAALPHAAGRSRIGLVLNGKGYDRALGTAVDEVNVAMSATDGFGLKNQGLSVDQQVQMLADIIAGRTNAEGAPGATPSSSGCAGWSSTSAFQPICGSGRGWPAASRGSIGAISPAIQPSPGVCPCSSPRSAISCMPTQMPRNGRRRTMAACVIASTSPSREDSALMQAAKAPTPGSIMPSAAASSSRFRLMVTAAPHSWSD